MVPKQRRETVAPVPLNTTYSIERLLYSVSKILYILNFFRPKEALKIDIGKKMSYVTGTLQDELMGTPLLAKRVEQDDHPEFQLTLPH